MTLKNNHNKKPIILIENLRLCSNEQIEVSKIVKSMNLEVRHFDTLKTNLKIINPKSFLFDTNEKYIIFCSIHTLKAILTLPQSKFLC